MRTNPHILEINTRAFLMRLAKKYGHSFTLADIPEEFLEKAKELGIDAIWLMGVWKESPKAREIAQNSEDINNQIKSVDPSYQKEHITASPYAVYEYTVDSVFGGDEALATFRNRLKEKGINLLLDFVGNHTAVDSPSVNEHPEWYISTGTQEPHAHKDWFFQNQNGVYVAHGRDPYFAPWTDTAQLNYFNPATRTFMMDNLKKVASMCDGVRCDMAMLSLNKVQRDTWGEFIGTELPKEEFWYQALKNIREIYPEFVFIAEVYWGLEWEIQEMGFDYTYDKVLYDRLRFSNPEDIRGHLRAEHLYQMRSIRFISNHDEEVALKAFGLEKSLAASTIIATLPGARMFHLFQIFGRPARLPIQYENDLFDINEQVRAHYHKLLKIASSFEFHGGQWSMREVSSNGDDSFRNILCWQWKQMNSGKIVFINYSDKVARGRVSMKGAYGQNHQAVEEFSGEVLTVTSELLNQGYDLELQPYQSKIFTYTV